MGTRSPAQCHSSREEIREESFLLRCCLNAAPGKANAGEAGRAPRTKPSKPPGTGEGDLGASVEEGTGKAPRRYGENSNPYQSLGPTEAKTTAIVWLSLSWQITGEQEPLLVGLEGPTLRKAVCRQEPHIVCGNNRD